MLHLVGINSFEFVKMHRITNPKFIHFDTEGKGKGKGKATPLQAWTGAEGSRRLRLPDFKTIGT